jgi:hypothetical protein
MAGRSVVAQRLAQGDSERTVIDVPTLLRIRFQICGGTAEGLDVPGADYEVRRGGTVIRRGTTRPGEDIEIHYRAGQEHRLRIFDTDYVIRPHAGLAPVTELAGAQKRLEILGYLTGYQLEPLEDDPPDDSVDGPRTQQAIMNFQADRGLRLDGLLGEETRRSLEEAAGE